MKLVTLQPFPTHPELDRDTLVWTKAERAHLEKTISILAAARAVVGEESETGMDLGKAEVVIGDWL